MQLELIRMVLKREAEKKNKNNKGKKKNKKKNKKKKKKKEEEEELCYGEGELRRELPNGVMEISPASPTRDYDNVASHCDVKVAITARHPFWISIEAVRAVHIAYAQVVVWN
ncbi:hypothetical protein V8G54_001448 [Vigna mungo]|uniref:Uncharacterized protein n=1 Tax=Vigna mungo TaxID=3915 RepID=A0AAQ3P7V2_VIGMU